eukprot:scaffold50536_cov66-Phaeocystis_antarctica.AAC.3
MACARTSFRCGAPPQCMTALRLTGDRSRPKRRTRVGTHQACIRAAVRGPDVPAAPPCVARAQTCQVLNEGGKQLTAGANSDQLLGVHTYKRVHMHGIGRVPALY